MKNHNLGCKILMIIGILLFLIGINFVLFSDTKLFSIINNFMEPTFIGKEIISSATKKYIAFLWKYIGLLHCIWGIFLFSVVKYALMKKEKWAWISVLMTVTGIYITYFNKTGLYEPFRKIFDPVFWQSGEISEGTSNFKGFIYSFSGTFLMLWGINSFFIVKYAFKPENKWAWNSLLITTLVWFLTMVNYSFYYKFYVNAIGDIIYFVILMFPLLFTRRYFLSINST